MDLAAWMAATGQTDDQVAEGARVSRATISRVRRRKMQPSVGLAKVLIALSGDAITFEALFGLAPAPSREAA